MEELADIVEPLAEVLERWKGLKSPAVAKVMAPDRPDLTGTFAESKEDVLVIWDTVREVWPVCGWGVLWPVQSLKAVPGRAKESANCFAAVFFSFFSISLTATLRLRAPRADMLCYSKAETISPGRLEWWCWRQFAEESAGGTG
jgi:hypothetical protein